VKQNRGSFVFAANRVRRKDNVGKEDKIIETRLNWLLRVTQIIRDQDHSYQDRGRVKSWQKRVARKKGRLYV